MGCGSSTAAGGAEKQVPQAAVPSAQAHTEPSQKSSKSHHEEKVSHKESANDSNGDTPAAETEAEAEAKAEELRVAQSSSPSPGQPSRSHQRRGSKSVSHRRHSRAPSASFNQQVRAAAMQFEDSNARHADGDPTEAVAEGEEEDVPAEMPDLKRTVSISEYTASTNQRRHKRQDSSARWWSDPSNLDGKLHDLFTAYARSDGTLHKSDLRDLVTKSVTEFENDYRRKIQRDEPTWTPEQIEKSMDKDLPSLLPGRTHEERVHRITKHFMNTLDLSGSGL